MKNHHYSMVVQWSETDSRYLAFVLELPGCCADGETLEEAAKQLALVIEDWLETAKELEMEIPRPLTKEADEARKAALSRKQQEQTQKYFEEFAASFEKEFTDNLREKIIEQLSLVARAQSGKLSDEDFPSGVEAPHQRLFTAFAGQSSSSPWEDFWKKKR